MRFARLSAFFRPLRFRLTAWNTAVVILIVVLTLLGVREGLRFTLLRELDVELSGDVREVSAAVEKFYPDMAQISDELQRKVNSGSDRELFVQLIGAQRKISTWQSRPVEGLDTMVFPKTDKPFTIAGFRVAQNKIDQPGLDDFTVRVGSALSMVDDDVWKVTGLMMLAGAAIVFVAPLGGYWLARRATSPIARIISTAARLRPRYLEERLPTRGTGDELDQLSSTINRFLDLIGDYLSRNRDFVANAAHELRSPLAAIQSSVDVALNSDRSVAEYKDLLGVISEQCSTLGTLVNQLLLLAETDAGQLDIKRTPVRLDQLVEKSVEMFRGAAEERGVSLVAEGLPNLTIEGDGDRLRQVVQNLVDNSLKFTPRGGQVAIRLRRASGGGALLEVADTGIGIPAGDLPHVFERFYRGDKSRHREDWEHGNGLGLSICQSIVMAHGGDISARSDPGSGAVFTVALPLTPQKPRDA